MPLNKIIELPKLDSQSDRLAVFCREPKHEQWAIPPRMGGTAVTLTRPSMVPRRLVFPLLELVSERAMTRMRFAHFVGCGRGSCLWTHSCSKAAAGLALSTSIFGFGPRVKRMSDVGHFVLLGPFRCRRSP